MTTFNTNTTSSTTQITSSLRRFAHWGWSYVIEIRTRRAQAASLSRLKERDLRDIGLIENDISTANHMPLEADAASALRCARLDRSGNW